MAETPHMTSSRPYLIRSLHEWISDNGMTPLMLADAGVAGVDVPRDSVKDGKIILNISLGAVRELELGDERIYFRARFNGVVREISVPVYAVLAIYARETSAGMMFPESADTETSSPSAEHADSSSIGDTDKPADRSHLRVIK